MREKQRASRDKILKTYRLRAMNVLKRQGVKTTMPEELKFFQDMNRWFTKQPLKRKTYSAQEHFLRFNPGERHIITTAMKHGDEGREMVGKIISKKTSRTKDYVKEYDRLGYDVSLEKNPVVARKKLNRQRKRYKK